MTIPDLWCQFMYLLKDGQALLITDGRLLQVSFNPLHQPEHLFWRCEVVDVIVKTTQLYETSLFSMFNSYGWNTLSLFISFLLSVSRGEELTENL